MCLSTVLLASGLTATGIAQLDATPNGGAMSETVPDTSHYTFYNPTPRQFRRPLSADRPDATESPYTVDAGAVQTELSFVEYTFDDDGRSDVHNIAVAPTNLKLGLTNDTDIQFIWTPYVRESVDDGEDNAGVGDLQTRLKINLWGNDAGSTALALLPYLTFPVGESGLGAEDLEGGIVVPFAVDLAAVGLAGFGLGTQVEAAFERSADDTGYRARVSHTVAIGYEVNERAGVYGEYIGDAAFDGGGYSPTLSTGATYALTPNALLDAGLRVGLRDENTDDLVVFAGLTVRF
ncbi:MAG: hypothetical protein CMJ31_01250 [Phycisphaerae bacterium]|nr:hypothetical protein [Phycisphaerae bacterium]